MLVKRARHTVTARVPLAVSERPGIVRAGLAARICWEEISDTHTELVSALGIAKRDSIPAGIVVCASVRQALNRPSTFAREYSIRMQRMSARFSNCRISQARVPLIGESL